MRTTLADLLAAVRDYKVPPGCRLVAVSGVAVNGRVYGQLTFEDRLGHVYRAEVIGEAIAAPRSKGKAA